MSEQPHAEQPHGQPHEEGDRREPDDSPQRRLVQTVQAYEVDPPAPARAAPDRPRDRSATGPEE